MLLPNMCSVGAISSPSYPGFLGKRILEQAVGQMGVVLEGHVWLRGTPVLASGLSEANGLLFRLIAIQVGKTLGDV